MRKEQLESDIYVLTGEAYQANATVLINGDEVLLIDGMANMVKNPQAGKTFHTFLFKLQYL